MLCFAQEVRWVFFTVLAQKSRHFTLCNPAPLAAVIEKTPLPLAVTVRSHHHRKMLGDRHVLGTSLNGACIKGFNQGGAVIVC